MGLSRKRFGGGPEERERERERERGRLVFDSMTP